MNGEFDKTMAAAEQGQEQIAEMTKKLMKVARPSAVFGEPVVAGDRTVITASEVSVVVGAGFGIGSGTGPAVPTGEDKAEASPEAGEGSGGGGGGGGMANGRPVAVISIEPDGVVIEPLFDATKVLLAIITAFGSMLLLFRKMHKES